MTYNSNIAEQVSMTEVITNELIRCKDWIESALEYSGGTHIFQDIVDGVLSGKMQLWAGDTGCAVTEIIVYPRKKVLHVFLAGGEMTQIIDFQKSAEEFGRIQGCDALTLAGRKGWSRVLSDYGWRDSFTVLNREL